MTAVMLFARSPPHTSMRGSRPRMTAECVARTAATITRLSFFSSARRRFSTASNTRSGVTGRSLKRMPMASATALVSAGRKAASEPSPASLAPNGPCGSMLSTMPTSIGGES